jgi:hypothetical protein
LAVNVTTMMTDFEEEILKLTKDYTGASDFEGYFLH